MRKRPLTIYDEAVLPHLFRRFFNGHTRARAAHADSEHNLELRADNDVRVRVPVECPPDYPDIVLPLH